jgi:iron complex outermembrane receptor protein
VGGSWLWQITDKLSWTNAIRLDSQTMGQDGLLQPRGAIDNKIYDRTIDAWSANSGLVYKAGAKDTLRLTYGRGIILPSLLQTGESFLIPVGANTFLDLLGNPYLAPTIVQNVEFGNEHRFDSLDSTLKTAVFYTHNHQVLGSPMATGPLTSDGTFFYQPFYSQNVGGSRAVGAEIELRGQNAYGFRWDASYSYVHVEDQTGVMNALAYASSTPEHHVRLSAGYTKGPWEVDANIQYLSQRSLYRMLVLGVSGPQHTSGYVTVGGRVAYTFANRYVLALSATELNHDDLQATSYPKVERQVLGTLTAHF